MRRAVLGAQCDTVHDSEDGREDGREDGVGQEGRAGTLESLTRYARM